MKNPVGVPMIDEGLRQHLFGEKEEPSKVQVARAIEELERFGYANIDVPDKGGIKFNPPEMLGNNIEEHWETIGKEMSGVYLDLAKKLANAKDMPEMPKEWLKEPGWVRYEQGETPEPVSYPDEGALIFDVETLVKISGFPVMACALSEQAYYLWLSPRLWGGSDTLVPLGDSKRIVIAHNASYDIARVEESYKLELNGTRYLDTLSIHTAVRGLSSKQRTFYQYLKKNPQIPRPPWSKQTCGGSLKDLVKFYTGKTMSKSERDIFVKGDVEEFWANFESLANYNAHDVLLLWEVYRVLFPQFLEKNPHPVTFAGVLEMSREFLPTDINTWERYKTEASKEFNRKRKEVKSNLIKLANSAIARWKEGEDMSQDPWLRHLDWNLPSKKARKLKNMPEWYRALDKKGEIRITASMQIAPYLLQLKWTGYPVYHHPEQKWGYLVPMGEQAVSKAKPFYLDGSFSECTKEEAVYRYYKVPHKDGDDARVGDILGKDYLDYFESGVISSDLPEAKQAIKNQIACSYWVATQKRVYDQFLVKNPGEPAIIIPQLLPCGTITRRATENTWLTASNAKPHKIGSEIKSTIRVNPEKYLIVGADVDSQEAWLSAIYGDANFQQIQGCTAYGMQILIGDKASKTDFHSNTAKITNRAIKEVTGSDSQIEIGRGDAKIFNYSRIYLAGVASTTMFLKQIAKDLPDTEAKRVVEKLFEETKGKKVYLRREGSNRTYPCWKGGTESHTFNYLESLANAKDPRTPVLGSGMSEAIHPRNLDQEGDYLTSRGNWGVQSSGVDFLHCLVAGTMWLCKKYDIEARLMLTIHDEYRLVVKKGDEKRLGLAMQVAHLWTRALIVYRLGFRDLPENIAWFSAIDVDWVLRKEADDPCVTPSQPEGIEPGYHVTMQDLINEGITLDN